MKSGLLAFALACPGSAILPAAVIAQQPAGPAMTDTPCPPPPPNIAVSSFLAGLLKPGAASMAPPDEAVIKEYQRIHQELLENDFAERCRFKSANAGLTSRPKVVFMGDSITEFWAMGDPSLFTDGVVDRAISGQTTPQMVLRFYQDVIALHPDKVHIMAGTNNLAGNTGPNSAEDFKNDIRTMVDLAQAHGIEVVLATIPPADHFDWRPDLRPAQQIRELNAWLEMLAHERGLTFVDYYSAMTTPTGGMKPELSNDGVHPNTSGYAVMRPLVDSALER